ncbi:MAG: hypothetical protein K1X89_14000 [Myxococcaceae bacterium]|nr:hypothetical protein [Myxococcaceae bacterium]
MCTAKLPPVAVTFMVMIPRSVCAVGALCSTGVPLASATVIGREKLPRPR